MSTLSSEPVAAVLSGLFKGSEDTKALFRERMGAMSQEDRRALMLGVDPRTLYGLAADIHLAISQDTGRLLYLLARSAGARTIIEFGTSFGVSTIHLAAAVRDNGGGRVIGSEFEASKVARARGYVEQAGLSDLVEIREGDALQTLAADLPTQIDMLFLDGAKQHYRDVFELVKPRLGAGSFVVADNAGGSGAFLTEIRSSPNYVSCALGDVELAYKLLGELDDTFNSSSA